MRAGIALNPSTPVNVLDDIITDADMILIMSVNPGFGGQKFIKQSLEKIRKTKELIVNTVSAWSRAMCTRITSYNVCYTKLLRTSFVSYQTNWV